MTDNKEPENRRIDIDRGNYNERIEGDYVQGNKFLNNTFALFTRLGNSESLTSAEHSRIRPTFLKQVNSEVKTRINSSLHNRVYVVLDVEQNPEQIELPWSSEIKVANQPKILLKDTNIITVFDQPDIEGRLLILGQPGSGKTTMLLKLAEELVKRAKDNSTHPIPALFSLSSWSNDNENIKDWLIEQLKEKYGLRKDIGKQWINNQEIIPLLDGLDELAAERQEKCVLKINQFLHPSNWINPVIVCSRIQEYQRYTSLLQLNSSLELYPFSPQQVYQYLKNTDNLQLWDSISHDADLSQLAKTPLLLNIIVLSAQEISVQTWQQFKSSEERLSYLFDAYIRRMFKRPYKDKNKQPRLENTQHWLSWLANRLIEESATEFFIERMQPDWLKNKIKKIIYNLIVWGVIGTLIFGLIFGFKGGLIYGLIYELYGLIGGGIYGLIGGMIYGLIYGVIGNLIENKIKKTIVLINLTQNLSITTISVVIFGVSYGLILGLIEKQITEMNMSNTIVMQPVGTDSVDLAKTLISDLISGLISGLIFGLIGNKIQTIKTLKFSLKKSLTGLIPGLISGLILGLIFGLISGLISGLIFEMTEGLIFHPIEWTTERLMEDLIFGFKGGLISGLVFGLISGLISGINGLEIENKTKPNEGIKQSVINTITLSTVTFLLATLIIFISEISLKHIINNQVLTLSLGSGIFFGMIIGILRSGIPVIKHFILRVILWSGGYIPWNYAKFLNYSTERLFLQRVGGGYRFMHDLLRQHFAKSYTQMNLVPTCSKPQKQQKDTLKNILLIGGVFVLVGYASWQPQLREAIAKAYYGRGLAYYVREDYDSAIADFNIALKLNPSEADAYYNRGNAYSDKKDYDSAIADFNIALKLYPSDAEVYYNRGLAYYHRGLAYYHKKDYDRAIADFNIALKLDPNDATAYNNRGLAYSDKKDYDRAIADFNQAIKLNPDSRCEAYRKKGDNDNAITDCNQALKLDPTITNSYYNRGLAYKNKGSLDKAQEDFKKVLEFNNDVELSQKAKQQLQELGIPSTLNQ